MGHDFRWDPPPLDPEDEKLLRAYEEVGRPIETLPYTEDFERIRELVGRPDTDAARNQLYVRLQSLRTMGLLPSLGLLRR